MGNGVTAAFQVAAETCGLTLRTLASPMQTLMPPLCPDCSFCGSHVPGAGRPCGGAAFGLKVKPPCVPPRQRTAKKGLKFGGTNAAQIQPPTVRFGPSHH